MSHVASISQAHSLLHTITMATSTSTRSVAMVTSNTLYAYEVLAINRLEIKG